MDFCLDSGKFEKLAELLEQTAAIVWLLIAVLYRRWSAVRELPDAVAMATATVFCCFVFFRFLFSSDVNCVNAADWYSSGPLAAVSSSWNIQRRHNRRDSADRGQLCLLIRLRSLARYEALSRHWPILTWLDTWRMLLSSRPSADLLWPLPLSPVANGR